MRRYIRDNFLTETPLHKNQDAHLNTSKIYSKSPREKWKEPLHPLRAEMRQMLSYERKPTGWIMCRAQPS